MGFWNTAGTIATGGIANKNFRKGAKKFLFGNDEKCENVSTLRFE